MQGGGGGERMLTAVTWYGRGVSWCRGDRDVVIVTPPCFERRRGVVGGRENPSTHVSSDRGRWLVVSYHSIKRKKVGVPLYAQKPLKTSIRARFEGCGGG